MAAIEWRKDLEIGVTEIDDQHRELFLRFNALLEACTAGKGREEVIPLLRFLKEYVITHFAAEERLQQRVGYPEYPSHRQQHLKFMDDLDRLQQELESGGATLSLVIKTNQMLVAWLINHISQVDRKLGSFVSGK